MNERVAPAWIKQELENKRKTAENRERNKSERLQLEKAIKADSPDFSRRFFKEVEVQVEACSVLGVTGLVESIKGESVGNTGVRFTLTAHGLPLRRSSTNLFHRAGDSCIRCYAEGLPEQRYDFAVNKKGELCVVSGSHDSLLSPEEAAQEIVCRECKRIMRG